MKMSTSVGLCAALAFGMGSTAVQAIKFVDVATTNPAMPAAGAYALGTITYAKETLLTGTANVTKGHHNISRRHLLSAPAEIQGAATDTFVVSYDLVGMVFSAPPLITVAGNMQPLSIASKGAKGDSSVVFRKDITTAVQTTDLIVLTGMFAVSEDGGTISRTVINQTLESIGVDGTSETHTATVAVAAALNEKVTAAAPAPVAQASSNFMSFDGGTRVSLGTIEIGVVTPNLRDARAGDDNVEANVDGTVGAMVMTLAEIAPAATTGDPIANPVTFSGNFGFVETLAVAANCAAGTTLEEIRVPSDDDPEVLTDETKPIEAAMFLEARKDDLDTTGENEDETRAAMHLCLEVDGEMAIPSTDPYMVMATYKGIASAASAPDGMDMAPLARIKRDGTTFRIPYITTADGYNQRFVIVNRGNATTYSFGEFEMEDGVMVADGMKVRGVLAEGTTVLRASEVVEITGLRDRAAGTISIVAHQSDIDAAVQQVNTGGDRSVDTVYLTAEPN